MFGLQGCVNLGRGGVQVALPARGPQQVCDRLDRQRASGRGGRGGGQHRQRIASGQVIERVQRRRVELPQHRTQLVGLPLPGPDQALMAAGQHPHRLGQLRIPRDPAVMRPIQTDDLSQHVSITTVGFRTRGRVALPIARSLHRVDRIHLITSRDQRGHPRTAIGFNTDHDITGRRILGQMICDQRMQPSHSRNTFREPSAR